MWIVKAKSLRSNGRLEWHEFPSREKATRYARGYDKRLWAVTLIYGQDCGQL